MVRTALRNRGLADVETLLWLPPALVFDLVFESGESGVVLGDDALDENAPDQEGLEAEAMAKWKKATTRAK